MSVDKLVEAAREGRAEELRELLAAGTPVDGVNAEGVDALTMAAAWGHVELVDVLIEAGAAPNGSKGSRNPLSAACTMRQVESVRRLLEHGADPNARSDDATPIMQVATAEATTGESACLELVSRLAEGGADLDAVDSDGCSALTRGVVQGRTELVRRLLQHGADPNVGAYEGLTLLDIAKARGLDEIAQLLLAGGATQ